MWPFTRKKKPIDPAEDLGNYMADTVQWIIATEIPPADAFRTFEYFSDFSSRVITISQITYELSGKPLIQPDSLISFILKSNAEGKLSRSKKALSVLRSALKEIDPTDGVSIFLSAFTKPFDGEGFIAELAAP